MAKYADVCFQAFGCGVQPRLEVSLVGSGSAAADDQVQNIVAPDMISSLIETRHLPPGPADLFSYTHLFQKHLYTIVQMPDFQNSRDAHPKIAHSHTRKPIVSNYFSTMSYFIKAPALLSLGPSFPSEYAHVFRSHVQ
jgi:hypothetical protein